MMGVFASVRRRQRGRGFDLGRRSLRPSCPARVAVASPSPAALRFGGWGVAGALAGVAWRSGGRAAVNAAPAGTPRAAATPFVCPGPSAAEMEIDGAYFCKQTFALCTTAPCERASDNPDIANCLCVVLDDYAIGYKTCAE
ncbi:MAG TPA: hypothetical protein VFQ80_09670, partial [Thermomicrobiales bacterium]|nr:hypothetical protein [Thermomicrobiales bacterium]